jgi:dolichol-phosphate mannosyltransferase
LFSVEKVTSLTLIIPAFNEEANIGGTVLAFHAALKLHKITHDFLIVDDGDDQTGGVLGRLKLGNIQYIKNPIRLGFGQSIRLGLERAEGQAVAIVMADMSDRPEDLVAYWKKLNEGYDCVFGSRFMRGGRTVDYPRHKLALNRLTNNIIRVLFGIRYNDTTNAFKLYRRETALGLFPILSHHFNITVELPLKAIVRGYSYAVVPNVWTNRQHGTSNLRIKEMGSRYFFIILYCWLEKWMSRGDYAKSRQRG